VKLRVVPLVPDTLQTPVPLDESIEKTTGLPEAPPVPESVAATPTVPAVGPVYVMACAVAAAGLTVIVRVCTAVPGGMALAAVRVIVYVPGVVGVPAMVAVPLPLSVKVRPVGEVVQLKLGAGYPVVVTGKVPAVPAVKVAVSALVKAGGVPTTIVNVWVAFGEIPLAAVIVMLVVPVAVGVPEMRAVPFPLSVKVNPAGMVWGSVMAGVGEPVVMMATAPAWLRVKSATSALVIAGAAVAVTVIVRDRVAVPPEALVAERVTG
jgi:hypothetical protein